MSRQAHEERGKKKKKKKERQERKKTKLGCPWSLLTRKQTVGAVKNLTIVASK